MPPLLIFSAVMNIAVAVGLGAAVHFWRQARRTRLPPDDAYDDRPSFKALQEYARTIDERSRLNARAAACVAVSALCQAGSMSAFLLLHTQP